MERARVRISPHQQSHQGNVQGRGMGEARIGQGTQILSGSL